ncbi:Beige protein-like 1 [Rhizina undulata]
MASASSSSYLRRRVSSAASSKPQLIAEIKPLLDSLESSASDPDILSRLQWLSLLKRILVDSPEAKDTFRALKGFSYLLSTLHSLSGFYNSLNRANEEKQHIVELIKCLFGVISEALLNHPGNRRFFSRKIGWDSLEQGLAATGLPTEAPDQLLGVLLGFAMDDATLSSLIVSVKRALAEDEERNGYSKETENENRRVGFAKDRVKEKFGSKDILMNAAIMPLVLSFQMAMPPSDESEITTVAVLQAVLSIASSSKCNLVAIHSAGLLRSILPRLWNTALPVSERDILLELAKYLIQLGINHLDDAKELYRRAITDDSVASFLLEAIRSSRGPPHIQFDLSLHGYASMELSSLGRTFPPTNTNGYTFSAWIYIDNFDPSMHTTLFGVFDPTQRCFILAYIEQDSRKFILQTSVASTGASVRFKTTIFEPKRWYHISLAHRRGRAISAAKAALYIDGEFVEQVKATYPQSPPNSSTSVQVFLGTPHDLSPRIGRGVVSSKWSLATAHLFEDILSDDLIAVHYRLGPRYYGNFQDCLGSFQTYEASAALNMRNELMHPGREEKSDIVSAIRHKASGILPEVKIMLNISATQILDDKDDNNIDESALVKFLSRHAVKNLQALTRAGAIAINGAVPSVDEALCLPHGVAIMTGEPIVAVPQPLDDAAWRIGGGAAVGLKLVEAAKTPEQVCRAVNILFEIVKGSWRNSEAMEKDNGFSVLGHLIRTKETKGVVGKELLRIVLGFVGFNHEAPEESFIVNPLAYRILLVDFDMWRKADMETQREYFAQFVTFCQASKFHHFNSKRLFRMRIVKKLLFALKGEIFSREILPDFMFAFKALVKTNMSADVLRSLALFVTYSLHKHNPTRPLRVKKSNVQLRRPPALGMSASSNNGHLLKSVNDLGSEGFTRQQIGVMVLEMYQELLCEDGNGTGNLKKFARTVTNKWLLYLLAENEPKVVILGAKILARLLVVHGSNYVNKFATKTGGFIIMRNRLKRWWNMAALWPICFSVLFGKDVAKFNLKMSLDFSGLVDAFSDGGKAKVVYPEMLPVIMGMLKTGIGTIIADQGDENIREASDGHKEQVPDTNRLSPKHSRRRSMSLNDQSTPQAASKTSEKRLGEWAKMIQIIVQFLSDLHTSCPGFREFCATSNLVQELFGILFPVVCSSDHVSAETELNSRDSALTFDGGDVVIRPLTSNAAPPIVRTITVDDLPPSPTTPAAPRSERLRRGSSFILVTSEPTEYLPSSARLAPAIAPTLTVNVNGTATTGVNATNSVVESLLEIVMAIFAEAVLERREFTGFGLNTKIPPGFQEHQIYFETYLLRNTLSHLNNSLSFNMKVLCEPRVLTNIGRFCLHITDCVYEGWFLSGAEVLLDFVGVVLEFLQRPEIARQKSVRLCSQTLADLRAVVSRLVLFRLSELDDPKTDAKNIVDFLGKMMYWQAVILSPENTDGEFTRLLCYLLYTRLIDKRREIKQAAADMLRIVLVQKPSETSTLLSQAKHMDYRQLPSGFMKLTELDNDTWLQWVDKFRKELDAFFYGALSKLWEGIVADENKKIEEISRTRISKRKEKLKQWILDDINNEAVYSRHEMASHNWMANIYASEHLKFQRAMQDQQDSLNFVVSLYSKLEAELIRPCGLFDDGLDIKWKLDLTEGRNRMRKRMLPDNTAHLHNYQPKRRLTGVIAGDAGVGPNKSHALSVEDDEISIITTRETDSMYHGHSSARDGQDDDFEDYELVNDPREDDDGWEDKNRKVMKSLQHGDIVEHVQNVSRLVGLDAVEGLLILGKNYLYLIDNFFQRSDGEIVNVWQAPKDERDQYLQMLSGRESDDRKYVSVNSDHETRHWPFEDLISISKRRFLFRDVALELFFTDGRSYLLTTMTMKDRDFLHTKLLSKAANVTHNSNAPYNGELWRIESLRTQDNITNFGSKLVNVFGSSAPHPSTRKWMKGEISNFHYLMLVNTMAGRTFNDLTQYPVFPWVLADYTSEELDLSNPRTFRDFSKPMGAQTPERQNEFRERYRAFEEIGDRHSPPFHYGTHFSSAMIVCSYLIRLQPFVQSYLLLQGGQFDHADRLFYSIEKAWNSASKENTTDVRELIPEFFFLPEFLVNSNGYNFGMKQGSDEPIDHVVLPPWAKGDPKIFIQKHREALESPYVSAHLHEWIDLVFGFRQRGEAAIEATNVFHHLSYHGAIDLDSMQDNVEKVATIGIIHNFGQTPHQVFTRAHPSKEEVSQKSARLDIGAEYLIRLPFPLIDSRERVISLVYSPKTEKVYCTGAFRLNMPPSYDKYMEWGFSDGSVRFYHSDSRKICGHHEHLHPGQLSCAIFTDSRTLVTAGTDGTIAVWQVQAASKFVELTPKISLFGHVSPVRVMASSRTFSTLVSASNDNTALVWDLNRLRFVRQLKIPGPAQCASMNDVTGEVLICTGPNVILYTLNGERVLEQNVCDHSDDIVTSCAFYEGSGNEWLERELIFTGHRRGLVNVWSKTIRNGKFTLSLVKSLLHVNQYQSEIQALASITSIYPVPTAVYTGDDQGRVYEWNCQLVQRSQSPVLVR